VENKQQIMKTLYKKDSKNKIRILELSTEGSTFFQKSGVIDGKHVIHEKICKPKNVGKSNGTTGEQQAVAEMDAKYTIKLSEGYFATIKEAEEEEVLLPMLAKSYDDHSKKIDWSGDVFIQPKLDGMRCLATVKDGKVTLMSRTGKAIDTMKHIEGALSTLPDGILDGELYAHGETFQDNMKMIKKYRKGKSENIVFHIYDMVIEGNFAKRYSSLSTVLFTNLNPILELVKTFRLVDVNGIKTYHKEFLGEGYEGSIIRHGDAEYKINGRSENLLKYKDFQDITAEIIDIEPAEQRPEWGVPVLKYSVKKLSGVNEVIFRAGTKMSHDERKEMLQNKGNYIGATAEIRFFEWTDDNIPRFPVLVGFRLDK